MGKAGAFLAELKRRHVLRVALLYLAVAWLVLQVADVLLPTLDAPPWGMRLVVGLLLLGFPLAMIAAWVFELSPAGLRIDPGPGHAEDDEPGARRLVLGMFVVLALAAGLFAIGRMSSESMPAAGGPPARSIAVLPFINDSGDPGEVYFSDGLAEELLNLLAGIPELRVVARTSSFRFRDPAGDVAEIGKTLKVRTVLEGMVRRAGDRVRVSAQLIDTDTGYHLWSQIYETRMEDIFAVQSDIAHRIAESLELVLTPEMANSLRIEAPTVSGDLYRQYLLARHLLLQRSHAEVSRSIEVLEEITVQDPRFARAWATLAAAYYVFGSMPDEPYEKYTQLAQRAATEASRLNPRLAEPHAVLALIHRNRFEWSRSDAAFERAIALEPGDMTARLWYGIGLCAAGRCEAAIPHVQVAAERDPLSAFVHSWLSSIYWLSGHVDEAEEAARRAADLGIEPWSAFHVAMERGRHAQAIAHYEAFWRRQENLDPGFVRPLVEAMLDASRKEAALQAVRQVGDRLDATRDDRSLSHRLAVYLPLGEVEEALTEARSIMDLAPGRRTPLLTLLWNPFGAAVRRDARFVALMEEVGLVDYWRQAGWPRDCRPEGGGVACF
jgi:TolB-like protein/Tfp pilus assembly protein PilF